MFRYFLASVLFFLIMVTSVIAQEKVTVAVLDLDMLAGVPESYKAALSDILREELFHTGAFRVIERNKMEEILGEQGFQLSGCTSIECAVEVGQLLGVHQMIAGSLSKLGDLHTVSLRIVDVETGEVLDMQSVRCNCSIEEIAQFSLSEAASAIAGNRKEKTEVVEQNENRKNLVNGPLPGMQFAKIPEGNFMMGIKDDIYSESKEHRVIISPFLMMTTEVTQEQWMAVMNNNPSIFINNNNPVDNVSWNDIQIFLAEMNKSDENNSYRLPTEAEWEYACRAGSETKFSNGDDRWDLKEVGWYKGNSFDRTHNVGEKEANEWGLFDMHGNVLEWCSDWYKAYDKSTKYDPTGPESGKYKILRGGSWRTVSKYCTAYFRVSNDPAIRSSNFGFRLVREINNEN